MARWVDHSTVRDINWHVLENDNGKYDADAVNRAILLDIRAELKKLNSLLHCHNFVEIPSILRAVKKNTTKRKKRPVKAKPKLRVVSNG